MRFSGSLSILIAALAAFPAVTSQTTAFERVQAPPANPQIKPEMVENCPGLVAQNSPRIVPASFKIAALSSDQLRITYIGHSTFLIESPRVVRIATDYNDYVRPPMLPDVVTMNYAHSTHYTDHPDPSIQHVLRGWSTEPGKPVRHDVTVKDVRVRNVPTNIRDYGGGTQRHGNSIFVFEIANMCVAHLGHLHHTLTQQQMNEIGRIDAVFVPVDGSYTLDLDGMVEVVEGLKAPLIIPMHYFSAYTLNRFLDRMREKFDIETADTPSVVISKTTLPVKPKVLVLPGR
jgi:L-ascorbate metabolism protein UlaG (beta-lactamase superfamily)